VTSFEKSLAREEKVAKGTRNNGNIAEKSMQPAAKKSAPLGERIPASNKGGNSLRVRSRRKASGTSRATWHPSEAQRERMPKGREKG